ncbi:MAG: 2-haloacrylate reductase [Anaerolineae bacterium]|nr:2-haloacrylate reductase [Anaerolineae bacterium]
MKAIRVHQIGEPDVMQLEEVAVPQPGPGQALVKIEASGVNFIDIYERTGVYPMPLPFTPGDEGAGVVEAVGPDVETVSPGDRVAYCMVPGTYSQYTLAPSERLVAVPESLSLRQAAAVLLQGTTAHYLTRSTYPLKPGETCLIHAAAGGTGQQLVQAAKIAGATVIGTVSTAEKEAIARQAGADYVIRYTQTDFAEETKKITNGVGVDVVYDSVGQSTFEQSLSVLRPRGMLVLFGHSSGKVPPFDLLRLNRAGSLYVTRPTLGHYLAERDELVWRTTDVFNWLAAGKLSLRIERELPLAEAAEAHRLLSSRKTAGKLLLIP